MGKCWPLQMPPTPKAVLISLADNANDHGECFPSITTICTRTCFKRTAVIEAIQWLEQNGLLVADRSNGRHTTYTILAGRVGDLFASRTGTEGKPVRQASRLRVVGGGNQSATRTASARQVDEEKVDDELFPHENGANQFASRTGAEDGPACDAEPTSPAGGPDPSASRTKPVRQADSNRQEPSVTVIEPSSAQARDDDEQLSEAEIERVLAPFPVERIVSVVSRNTLARFIRHRTVMRRPVSVAAWFELQQRFAELLRGGHDLELSLRQTMLAGLAIPVTPKLSGESNHADRSHRSAGLGQRVAANAERAVRAAVGGTVFDGTAVRIEDGDPVGSPD
ncbi:MAG TPA: helix-turn-helix domain-containing protein [Pseudoxanthomonas sp.]